MLTISELPSLPISNMRSTTAAATPTTNHTLQPSSEKAPENGTPSQSEEMPAWRHPQLAKRSTPFQLLPELPFDEKHRAAQDAATTAAVRYFDQSTVRYALERIKYLLFTKWTQSANPIDDWEIQNSGQWTTVPMSILGSNTTTNSSTMAPSDSSSLSDSSMDISSTRPTSPAERSPFHFSPLNPAKIFVQKVTEVHTDSDSDSEEDYRRARKMDAPNPYLVPGAAQPTWNSPPPSPIEGNDLQPPRREACGARPGQEWLYNTPGEQEYFRFLITNPRTSRACVAPWLKYTFTNTHATISATFGDGHPVFTRTLSPTPVNYTTKILNPQESRLFNSGEPFTPAVDFILQHAIPYDVLVGVRQYRYYRDLANATHVTIRENQEKFTKQLERTMELLSDLENADVFNRIINLKDCAQLEMSPDFDAMQCLNIYLNSLTEGKYLTAKEEDRVNNLLRRIAAPTRRAPSPPRRTTSKPMKVCDKYCYKCGGKGHLRAQCPSPCTLTTRAQRTWPPVQRK